MSCIMERINQGKFVLIAEIGVNYYDIAKKEHISNLEAAKLMVQEAKKAGIDLSPVGVSDTALVEGILMHRGKRLQEVDFIINRYTLQVFFLFTPAGYRSSVSFSWEGRH